MSALPGLPLQLFIDGQWRDSADGTTFPVHDPAFDRVLTEIADATPADALRALDAASAAADAWAKTPARVRSGILLRTFELVVEHADDIARLITLEMGKPLSESAAEVRYGGEFLRWFAEEAVRAGGRTGSTPEGTGAMLVTHRPVGPCYLITPWNFPLAMATRKIGPALAAGCTAVIKPAALTPLTTLYLVSLFEQAGLPEGVLNAIPSTRSAAVSDALMRDPRLRKVSFTGSTGVGRTLLKQAADNILRTSMELGGNAPFLVFDDADLDAAVDGAMIAKFRNVGQACTAANRFLVQEDIHDRFVERLAERVHALRVGPGLDAGVDIGPLINRDAAIRIGGLVDEAVAAGGYEIVGGPRAEDGAFFPPTIVTDVPTDSRLYREEIFGPVVSITKFTTEAEAVDLANSTEYGLAAYAYTADLARGHRLMASIDAGMLGVNSGAISNPAAPFGGTKQSGLGREGGNEGIHEYLDTKYAFVPGS
ncbi:NAD-dependent succinate-semialdehyde dehydrogenase [Microbacterium sp. SSM24]|uniref:NAD-dependent succinate-semialdehyde dehydrogenase n=1 Tax=Microbacterium sp. SSM24 TaxID=2991714 RepID=UPI002225FFB2|nr:NAD-dependent succinate-semialdehyde dehydrogenase [Microbacterium sp. SSM24]MCW3492704.1 NAD-dependent succinate-semialdehyde dehydrogenase [Microbacterium sp. SSM24]